MILNIKLQEKNIANQTRKDNAGISLNIKMSHSNNQFWGKSNPSYWQLSCYMALQEVKQLKKKKRNTKECLKTNAPSRHACYLCFNLHILLGTLILQRLQQKKSPLDTWQKMYGQELKGVHHDKPWLVSNTKCCRYLMILRNKVIRPVRLFNYSPYCTL